jgi:2',3'-cyclic-nucleotide 2'-phosphodiesterase (5'-nucleotidase family)
MNIGRLTIVPALLVALANEPAARQAPGARVTISVVGTNDLHGHLEALPALGGYLANLRRARARDGGAVVLLDGGDMFQGTLESSLGEGAGVVRAYGALGYAAVAIGNHEFDFGPVGEAATPERPGDDPRGALKARAAEARFPFLTANVIEAAGGRPVRWPNVRPSVLLEAAGVKIGVVGVTTASTPRATIAVNFAGLAPLAPAVTAAARALRAAGATVVLVAAHAGGGCRRFDDPDDLSSCDAGSEIFRLARALPPGAVDAVVAGHTHDGLAHRVAGIPIVEGYANGRAFGRVDLSVDRASGRVVGARLYPPQPVCAPSRCAAERYEGAPVVPDEGVTAAVAADRERARSLRDSPLGVTVTAPIMRAHEEESPLGNLFADLMHEAFPGADLALINGGALRADLPAGPLTYGRLFEASPFDNRFALVRLTGDDLRRLLASNLAGTGGIVSLSGLRVAAACDGARLKIYLQLPDGRDLPAARRLTLVTSDFLAMGGDGLFPAQLQRAAEIQRGPAIRDVMAKLLRARGGSLGSGGDIFHVDHPRISYPGTRPVSCRAAP